MITTNETLQHVRVAHALAAGDPSVRLRAALAAGADPDPALLETLLERCAVEPDFFVRDMLSWALTRFPPESTLPLLRDELGSRCARARSQALHTLSKIGDASAWAWMSRDLLRDPDDDVARTAWRVAVTLVPEGEEGPLVGELVGQLGRGDPQVQLSLSRALIGLGDVVEAAVEEATADPDPAVAAHARATRLLLQDPEIGFEAAVDEARRVLALGPGRATAAAATGAARSPEAATAAEDADAARC